MQHSDKNNLMLKRFDANSIVTNPNAKVCRVSQHLTQAFDLIESGSRFDVSNGLLNALEQCFVFDLFQISGKACLKGDLHACTLKRFLISSSLTKSFLRPSRIALASPISSMTSRTTSKKRSRFS